MTAFLETSVLVRYLVGAPQELADRAGEIIDRGDELWITDVVLAEAAWVLTSFYRLPRPVVVDHLTAFLQRQNIALFGLEKALAIQAMALCRPSGRVSFADALIWVAARTGGATTLYSFDERFPSIGIEVRRSRS